MQVIGCHINVWHPDMVHLEATREENSLLLAAADRLRRAPEVSLTTHWKE
jgi:hypothetical protein